MTARDFCYWLQGFFEIHSAGLEHISAKVDKGLIGDKVECIKRHLALVFLHEIDPSMGGEKHQKELNAVHNPQGGTVLRC